MSNVKKDLMKEIEAKVAKKKALAKQVSRQKTVANWVAEFFTEYENSKRIDGDVHWLNTIANLAISRLNIQLRGLDRGCRVTFRPSSDSNPTVEIQWGSNFVLANNCEEVLVLDASSAYFQSALEDT